MPQWSAGVWSGLHGCAGTGPEAFSVVLIAGAYTDAGLADRQPRSARIGDHARLHGICCRTSAPGRRWSEIASPLTGTCASGIASGSGEIHFDAAELAEPDLGHIIENRVISTQTLWRRARGPRARPCDVKRQVRNADATGGRCAPALADGSAPRVGLLVRRDGAKSQVREMAGNCAAQRALRSTRRGSRRCAPNLVTARRRGSCSCATGRLALLPTQRDLFSIVWSTHPESAQQPCDMPEETFNAPDRGQ